MRKRDKKICLDPHSSLLLRLNNDASVVFSAPWLKSQSPSAAQEDQQTRDLRSVVTRNQEALTKLEGWTRVYLL